MPSSALKEKSEPKRLFVFLYAISLAAFGVFFGILYLMSFPLKAYSSMEERAAALAERASPDPVPGDAFYIEGPTLRTRSWEAKREQLITGSPVSLQVTPGEINAWFGAKFRSAASAANDEASGLTLVPDIPNIGISEDGTIFLNLPAQLSGYGMDGAYVLSARVHYAGRTQPSLKVDHLQIGGAPIPMSGLLGAQVVSTIIKSFSSAEEYAVFEEAWGRVESVESVEGALVLTLKRP